MKGLVVYDSAYGNTEQVAHAIAGQLRVPVVRVSDVTVHNLQNLDLLVIGSPTQGGRPTVSVGVFVSQLPKKVLTHTKIAVFDTRFAARGHGFLLKLLMKMTGFAAEKLARRVNAIGGTVIAERGFIVSDTKGPLKQGELHEAAMWARSL